ncbi:MAG TPA: methylated-DNA--[protein]-cysteine S-methyltransferase [Nitrospirae bacterium]|nr:methylated-DNA--[protein]-cysteine S-methyltransferase [Nitrospirota bacterium]
MSFASNRLSTAEKKLLIYAPYLSPLGEIYPIFLDSSLVGVEFKKPHLKMHCVPNEFRQELDAYFNGELKEFAQEVRFITGTLFEQKVWNSLRAIPYGETRSYKWLAADVGSPRGNRAVGRALSKNPIPIVLACHRVIESTGKLGGYSSGVEIKRRLLAMEFYNK